jgi:hypothetical protein
MSEPVFDDWYLDPQQDSTELSAFLEYTDLLPEAEAALWREQDPEARAYDDFFEDDDAGGSSSAG